MPTAPRPPCWTLDDINHLAGLDPAAFALERERLVLVSIDRFRNPDDGHTLQSRIDTLRWSHGSPLLAAAQLIQIAQSLAGRAALIADRLKTTASGSSPDPA